MKRTRLFNFITILLLTLSYPAAFVRGETVFFDADGNVLGKESYQEVAASREKILSNELRDGYDAMPGKLKDPIKLRKKRIEQWKMMRADYNPEALPSKIENPSK